MFNLENRVLCPRANEPQPTSIRNFVLLQVNEVPVGIVPQGCGHPSSLGSSSGSGTGRQTVEPDRGQLYGWGVLDSCGLTFSERSSTISHVHRLHINTSEKRRLSKTSSKKLSFKNKIFKFQVKYS